MDEPEVERLRYRARKARCPLVTAAEAPGLTRAGVQAAGARSAAAYRATPVATSANG